MADTDHLPSNSYIPESGGLGRPVDRRQETYRPSGHASRPIPPHGDVSPDGRRVWPQPSMTSRVLVYGGMGIAAAAATAGAILTVRKVADLVTGNDELDRDADRAAERARVRVYDEAHGRYAAPRMAAMPEHEREAMRARARARMRQDDAERDRLRADAQSGRGEDRKPRRPRDEGKRRPQAGRGFQPMGFIDDVEQTAQRLTRTVNEVAGSISAAVAAFRSVASQAQDVLHEFGDTANQVRSFLGTGDAGQGGRGGPRRDPYRRPSRSDVVDLRDPADSVAGGSGAPSGDADGGRTHRL
ncbi:hypothetical protein [Paracoccus niistensis]|uniref:Uncharacterized protein n=1 Tax=Paracoccus niistensis TaxID=632935 RepID=A0ABV6I5A9_9RHOB